MDCKYLKELLSIYIDGYAKPDEIKLIEEHLSSCRDCKGYFLKLKETTEILRNLEKIEAPVGFEKKVMHKLEEKEKSLKWFFSKKFILELSAAFFVFISIMLVYLNTNQSKKELSPQILSESKVKKIEKESKPEEQALHISDYGEKNAEIKREEKVKTNETYQRRQKDEEGKEKKQIASMAEDKYLSDELKIGKSEFAASPTLSKEKIRITVEQENFHNVCKKIEEILENEKIEYKKIELNEKIKEFSISSKDLKNFFKKISHFEGLKIDTCEVNKIQVDGEVIIWISYEEKNIKKDDVLK